LSTSITELIGRPTTPALRITSEARPRGPLRSGQHPEELPAPRGVEASLTSIGTFSAYDRGATGTINKEAFVVRGANVEHLDVFLVSQGEALLRRARGPVRASFLRTPGTTRRYSSWYAWMLRGVEDKAHRLGTRQGNENVPSRVSCYRLLVGSRKLGQRFVWRSVR
jgi:hypothetical protein